MERSGNRGNLAVRQSRPGFRFARLR